MEQLYSRSPHVPEPVWGADSFLDGELPIRPLLIAEAANPEWASVPLVGWSLATAIARATDAHIVTQVRNREAFLRAGLREGTDFTAIDSEAVARPLWRLASGLRGGRGVGWTTQTAISSIAYPYFERLVWQHFEPRLRSGEFDLVHRITPLTPTAVSSLAQRSHRLGVPFVLGPLNGGVPWPTGFDATRRSENEWLSYARWLHTWRPSLHAMYRCTDAVLCGSRHTQGEVPGPAAARTIYLPENAIDPARFHRLAQPASGPLDVCFVGRLVPYKGPDMLLEAALPLLQRGVLRLNFVGDGPLAQSLRDMAREAGVETMVSFHGWVEHTRVQDLLCSSHVMALPSVREFGGGVVLEAMALGVVPLVVDYAGPGELVDDSVGFKVPMGERASIVTALRERLEALAHERHDLARMASAARTRVHEHFTWDVKARQVIEAYRWVLGRRDSKPEFGFVTH